ncbi:MAG: hypothetical protein ACRBBP_08190 [Bdellovibrionales bacterium]
MKLRLLILQLTLPFLCQQANAGFSCKSILSNHPSTLRLSPYKRDPHEIGDSDHSKDAVEALAPHIKGTRIPPHTREQCYGTCYAYSNAVLVENALKQQHIIPADGLLLTAPILSATALRRMREKPGLSIEESINGGNSDLMYDLSNSSIFYVTGENIASLGSSKNLLSLETSFFREFAEGSFKYRGQGLKEVLLQGAIFSPQRNTTLAFQEYVKQKTGVPLNVSRASISSIRFFNIQTHIYESQNFLISSHISTATHPAPRNTQFEVGNFLRLGRMLPGSPFSFASSNFMEKLLPSLIKKLKEDHFVRISFQGDVFGEPHTVILTNLVINRDNNTLLGFLFLNSHSTHWGSHGYGFVSVQELLSYATGYEILNHLEVVRP